MGLLPVCAVTVIEPSSGTASGPQKTFVKCLRRMPELLYLSTRPGLAILVWASAASGLVNDDRLRRLLLRMLDENEF